MDNDPFAFAQFDRHRLHQSAAFGGTVSGVDIHVFAVQTVGTMICVAVSFHFPAAVFADEVFCFSNNKGEASLYKCNENKWEVLQQCPNGCDKTIRGCEPSKGVGDGSESELKPTNMTDLLKCIDKDTLDLKDGPFKCEFGCGISDGSARCKQPECKEIGGEAKCSIENGIDCSKNSKFYCIVSKDGKTANKYQMGMQ